MVVKFNLNLSICSYIYQRKSKSEYHPVDRNRFLNQASQASVERVESSEQVGHRHRPMHVVPHTNYSRNVNGSVADRVAIHFGTCHPFVQASTSFINQPGVHILPGTFSSTAAVSASSEGDCAMELDDESARRHRDAAALNEINSSVMEIHYVPNRLNNFVYPANSYAFITHSQRGHHLPPEMFV